VVRRQAAGGRRRSRQSPVASVRRSNYNRLVDPLYDSTIGQWFAGTDDDHLPGPEPTRDVDVAAPPCAEHHTARMHPPLGRRVDENLRSALLILMKRDARYAHWRNDGANDHLRGSSTLARLDPFDATRGWADERRDDTNADER